MKKNFCSILISLILSAAFISCSKDDEKSQAKVEHKVIDLKLSLSEYGTVLKWDYQLGNSFQVFINGTALSGKITESQYLIKTLILGDIIKVKSHNKTTNTDVDGELNYAFSIESIVGKHTTKDNYNDYKEFYNSGIGKSNYGMSNSSFEWELRNIKLSEPNSTTGQLEIVDRMGVAYTTPHNDKEYTFEYKKSGSSFYLRNTSDNFEYYK
jgi:hypothetical protein